MSKVKKTDKFERLNINVPTAIMDGIRRIQEETGLNKTSVVIMALKSYNDQNDALKMASLLSDTEALKKLIKDGKEADK